MARPTLVLVSVAMLLAGCRERATPDAGASAAKGPAAGPEVKVVLAPLKPGSKLELQHTTTLAFNAVVTQTDGATSPSETGSDEAVSCVAEVLAADGAELTKAKLTFDQAKERTSPTAPWVAQPIEGKSYLVQWGPSSVTVTRAEGTEEVPVRESALVRMHADLFRPSELQLALTKPQPSQVNVPDLVRAFATTYIRREDAKGGPPSALKDVFASVEARGDVLVVKVKGELHTEDPSLSLYVPLSGTIEVARDTGIVRAMRLEGPVERDVKNKGKSSGRLAESFSVK